MGAIHHLSRLERSGLQETELALSLYRDNELLRAVLRKVRLPEAQDRVAIALRGGESGPHLVVTREGDFVTCLGEGRPLGELPVVARGRLEALSRRHEALRARLESASAQEAPGESVNRLMARLREAGHLLSREEFEVMSVFGSLIPYTFASRMIDAPDELLWSLPGLLDLADASLRSPLVQEKLLRVWNRLWEVAHLTALCVENARVLEERLAARGEHLILPAACLMELDFLPIGARAAMLLSRVGKAFLPEYQERLREAASPLRHVEAVAVLLSLGIRYESLRARVGKTLARLPALVPEKDGRMLFGDLPGFRDSLLQLLESPSLAFELHARRGGRIWQEWTRKLAAGSPLRFSDPECPAARRAAAFARFNHPETILGKPIEAVVAAGAAALVKPASLCASIEELPELRKALDEEWVLRQTARYLARYRLLLRRRMPERVEREAARTERCPSHGGKRLKRCKGRAA